VIQVSASWPPAVTTLDGIVGKGGFEGIHPDDRGNLLIIEDSGGTGVNVNPADPNSPKTAKQPNSFVYRFVPCNKADILKGGKLQALQVSVYGQPLIFNPADPVGDTFSPKQLQLHTPGASYPVKWVTIHDTAVDGTASFNANAAAKTAGATPFKRPENGQFRAGSNYRTFFFCPTGDTDADAGGNPDLAARGSWGSIFRVDLNETRNRGRISIFFLGDADHASFDNLTFGDVNTLLAAEDRGDSLHNQLNKLDSVWAFPLERQAVAQASHRSGTRCDVSCLRRRQRTDRLACLQRRCPHLHPTGFAIQPAGRAWFRDSSAWREHYVRNREDRRLRKIE